MSKMPLRLKLEDARSLLVPGTKYKIKPYPKHLAPDFFAVGIYVGPKGNHPGHEHVPPIWMDVFDFSEEKDKAFNRIMDGFYTAIPGWRDHHIKKRLMPVDGSGIVEIDEKEMFY